MHTSKLNWPTWNVCHSFSAWGLHAVQLGPFYINKDNEPGVVWLVMRWLQVKNTSIKQEGLLCNKKKVALVMQWHRRPKCLHMNASEPLIYYSPIVGEPCEHGDGCSSISVPASQKSSNYGASASGARGHLDVCLPGKVPVKWASFQPSTPLGFGPCGPRLQSQWLGSTSLVWWCNDEALITTNEYRRTASNL